MATKQDVVARITNLLFSKAAQTINFQLDSVHFVGSQFGQVATKVFLNQLGFSGVGVAFVKMDKGAAAQYDPAANEFEFPNADFGVSPDERAAIVHEGIHAWLDVRMPRVRTLVDAFLKGTMTTTMAADEATAYVGGVLFYIYDNTEPGSKPKMPAGWTSPIFAEAFRIAAGIWDKPGAVVSKADAASLKQKIMDNSAYDNIKANPTGSYGNDGV
jgi:hypothetical protein